MNQWSVFVETAIAVPIRFFLSVRLPKRAMPWSFRLERGDEPGTRFWYGRGKKLKIVSSAKVATVSDPPKRRIKE